MKIVTICPKKVKNARKKGRIINISFHQKIIKSVKKKFKNFIKESSG